MARERWANRGAFIMAAIGSAIGLGNVWRFPYMAASNGGAVFFIPYVIALITTGIPLIALEYYLGARSQKGPSEAYGNIKKGANYIGWFALLVAAMITIYYCVIMGWSWNYVAHSIGVKWSGAEGDFFFGKVLGISDGIFNLGGVQWLIVIGNFLTWAAIFFIVFKGVKIVGKVVNWTVSIPWILLLILIIRGITLKGSGDGLEYYLNPDFSKLWDPKIWLAAYGQIFFSLSLGFGIMIAYSSYMPKDTDINTNAWVVSFANCSTSFFAGFAVFSTLGFLAFQQGAPVAEVAGSGGVGMAFVVYPAAIATLPGGVVIQSLFGIAFFLMLLTLGIDSAFSLVEAIITGIKDTFKWKRETVAFWVCAVGFLLGTLYATKAGLYWLDLVDHWMNWGLVIVGLLEAVLIAWFFNVHEVAKDIDSTSSLKFGGFWIFTVKYLTPVILVIILATNFVTEFKGAYGGYPSSAIMIGGWGAMIVLFFLALWLQERRQNLLSKIVAYPLMAAGIILSAIKFYEDGSRWWAALILVGTVLIGTVIVRLLRKKPAVEA